LATTSAIDVVMPQMGVSVSEGTITKWLKQEGEEVAADEPLLEISTDKVDTEVPSPGDGVVQQILVQEGETVEVGTKLAVIAPAGAEAPAAEPEPAEPEAEPEAVPEPATAQAAAEASAVSDAPATTPTADEVEEATPAPAEASATTGDDESAAAPAAPTVQGPSTNGKTFVSPVVARIAAENNIDPSQVPGTGQGGRVTKKDILSFIESSASPSDSMKEEAVAEPAPAPPPTPSAPAAAPAPPPAPAAARAPAAQAEPVAQGETEESMSAMRRGIAEHMRRSLDTSAHVTSAIEVDMTKVVGIREKLKKEYQSSYGVNPTYLAFIARATVETLKDYPWINGELRGDKIVTRSFVNLGFAVELTDGKGLIVPVVKNAETLNLLGMAKSIVEIAERARSKQLTPDDVTGGTFTITNPGGYGTFHGTPVISQPQAGILGTYAIVKRPWVVQDEFGKDAIAIRSMMNLTLTYDHRLVDGALAGRFLRDLREKLQTWGEPDY
jgi:pyruvate dehydrogenase E2 component (dihydrolipoamide acetyltransferase)